MRWLFPSDTVKADQASAKLFLICEPDTTEAGYAVLDCEFAIRIEESKPTSYSALPTLYVEDIEPNPRRHINSDRSACLCSPLEESEFLMPQFFFQSYFERLVVPFLYGQAYFSLYQRWPWSEYSHSVVGLLESYAISRGAEKTKTCLALLKRFPKEWRRIRAALLQRAIIKRSAPCFCKKRGQIARCHPAAMEGLQRLRNDIIEFGIRIWRDAVHARWRSPVVYVRRVFLSSAARRSLPTNGLVSSDPWTALGSGMLRICRLPRTYPVR
jgi:hypothetical protein